MALMICFRTYGNRSIFMFYFISFIHFSLYLSNCTYSWGVVFRLERKTSVLSSYAFVVAVMGDSMILFSCSAV